MAQPKSNPPVWQPDAVATARGWAHPKTGEILVATRGLLDIEVESVEEPSEESVEEPSEEEIQKIINDLESDEDELETVE